MREIVLILSAACVCTATAAEASPEVLCPGDRLEVVTPATASLPYVELSLDGQSGAWLIDYGYTNSHVSSRVWKEADQAADAWGTDNFGNRILKLKNFTFPSWGNLELNFVHSNWEYNYFGVGLQHGIVGVDLLANQSVELHYEDANDPHIIIGPWGADCPTSELPAKGFKRISQIGYFTNGNRVSLGVANTPVVFIDFEEGPVPASGAGSGRLANLNVYAQIDTGYDDGAYPYSVDINPPLEKLLLAQTPAPTLLSSVKVKDCDGAFRERRSYSLPGRHLRVQTETGEVVRRFAGFYIIAKDKQPLQCGGITQSDEPAAQLGASFLRAFGTTIFLPRAEEVWIKPSLQ